MDSLNTEAIHNVKVVWHSPTIIKRDRFKLNNHKSTIVWFTGLSGAGKSTLAHAVEERLYYLKCRTYVLDGDNIRHGLCHDLNFTSNDRQENIRRVGEVAKLFVEAGVIVMAAFISPFREDRDAIRRLVNDSEFLEVFCDCPVEVCESRDVKGMYKKARVGEIQEFTGISSPYEKPTNPDLIINTAEKPLDYCVESVVRLLVEKNIVKIL